MAVSHPHLILFAGQDYAGTSLLMERLFRAYPQHYRIVITTTTRLDRRDDPEWAALEFLQYRFVKPAWIAQHREQCVTMVDRPEGTYAVLRSDLAHAMERTHGLLNIETNLVDVYRALVPIIVLENSFAPGTLPHTVEGLHAEIVRLTTA